MSVARKIRRERHIILGVDIGTTNVKCYAYDNDVKIIGRAIHKLPVQDLSGGGQEIVPDELWTSFKTVVRNCLLSGNLIPSDISSMGISTQRGTFVTWDRNTGEPFHNFITWKDKRANSACASWNSANSVKILRLGAYVMYLLTQMQKFQLLSRLQFSTAMVLIRLYWIFQISTQLQNKELHKNVLFGTIETWLVWKLTGRKVHATDVSSACATGFFDPFQLKWAKWILKMFGIPSTILPVVLNTSDSFGEILPEIFGNSIPIHALVGDQQASLFGSGCFEKYDMTCTMGTGSFLTMNSGSSPLGAYDGFYPLVGWKIASNTTYITEGGVHDVGNVLAWSTSLGLIDDLNNADRIALTVPDNGNVYFLPGANVSEQYPQEPFSSSSFVGMTTHTSREHLVRSILEALSFQVCELYRIACDKYGICKKSLFCVSGGVSKSDFIVQTICNITNRSIYRSNNTENSSFGAALLAGLYSGIWKDQHEIKQLIAEGDIFCPNKVMSTNCKKEFTSWKNAYSHSIIPKQV